MLTLRESVNAPLFLCPDLWVTWPSCPCPVPCPGIADIWWVPVLCPAVVPPAPVVVVCPVCTPAGMLSICLAAVLCCLACCLSNSAWVFLSSFLCRQFFLQWVSGCNPFHLFLHTELLKSIPVCGVIFLTI